MNESLVLGRRAAPAFHPHQRTIHLDPEPTHALVKDHSQLGASLFKAGFRDLTRAGLILYTLWQLRPLGGIFVRDAQDRVVLNFTYVRNKSGGELTSPNKNVEDTDHILAYLCRKLSFLTTPYLVETHEGFKGENSALTLTFIKTAHLVMLEEAKVWLTRRPSNWSEVDPQPLTDSTAYRQRVDSQLISWVKNTPASQQECIDIEDHWRMHRSVLCVSSDGWAKCAASSLSRVFPQEVYERYRFAIKHRCDGKTEAEILRRYELD